MAREATKEGNKNMVGKYVPPDIKHMIDMVWELEKLEKETRTLELEQLNKNDISSGIRNIRGDALWGRESINLGIPKTDSGKKGDKDTNLTKLFKTVIPHLYHFPTPEHFDKAHLAVLNRISELIRNIFMNCEHLDRFIRLLLGTREVSLETNDRSRNFNDQTIVTAPEMIKAALHYLYEEDMCRNDVQYIAYWNGFVKSFRAGLMAVNIGVEEHTFYTRPKFLATMNVRGVTMIHRTDGPAVEWHDGSKEYFAENIFIPDKFINKKVLDAKTFHGIRNVEVKRAITRYHGTAWLQSLYDLTLVDTKFENNQTYELYRSKKPDPVANEHIQFVKVTCPSTGREYWIGVEPTIKDALEAVASTGGFNSKNYRPVEEA